MRTQYFCRELTFVLLVLTALFFIASIASGEGEGNCSESGNHSVSNWIRVYATPADPMPEDGYEVIASVEVFENGSWSKEWNDTIGELVRKPDSPDPQVIDRQNGSEEGIRLFTSESGTYRVWAGVCRNEKSYWNYTNVTIFERNHAPSSIALLGINNGSSWTTNLSVWIEPGEEVTVFFNGSRSTDQDADDLDYFWDVDNRAPIDDLEGPWANWTFSEKGSYPITLTVGDGIEIADMTVMLHIHYAIFPDLTISSVPFLSEEEFKPGEPVNVTTRIQNQGEDTAGPFSIYVYDHDLDNQKNITIFIQEVDTLGVNDFFTLSFTWTTTNRAEAGTHILRVFVDFRNDVVEENESNNQAWGRTFIVHPENIDLAFITIKDMAVSNETPLLFHMVNITLTVSNSGTGPAELLTIFLLVNGEEYDKRYLPFLGPGKDEIIILSYSASLKGSYNLTCSVYDNGFLQGSEGRRIVIKDIQGPTIIDKNETDPRLDYENLDWLMMGAGIFMIVIAIAIQIVGRKAREK